MTLTFGKNGTFSWNPSYPQQFNCYVPLVYNKDNINLTSYDLATAQRLRNLIKVYMVNERSISISLKKLAAPNQDKGILQIHSSDILLFLRALFASDDVFVEVKFTHFQSNYGGREECNLSSKKMHINASETTYIVCEDQSIDIQSLNFDNVVNSNRYRQTKGNCGVTVVVTVKPRIHDKMITFKRMLHDEIDNHGDALIIPGSGNAVKCHKAVLSACSSTFQAMFLSGMKESLESSLELKDMSEGGVNAFLAYIYYLSEDEPNKNCEVALQLLEAGHKYDVRPCLEKSMTNIFLSKPVEWYNVDVAVKLYAFSRNLPSGKKLKSKSLTILKEKAEELQQSEACKELFSTNVIAAIELCQQLAFQAKKNSNSQSTSTAQSTSPPPVDEVEEEDSDLEELFDVEEDLDADLHLFDLIRN